MKNIGLALSGGGFRASLYHLGLIRFLRDAGILPQVTHITSVSGGSIIAAHLALNWDRYNGSPNEFDAVASELLDFVRLDVRNRITRRFPLSLPLRWPRRLLGRSNRKLTRTGLLEYHYEKYLYGDTSLFELPEKPQLHILATNLSEGCLCSFNRNGLLMVRRRPGNGVRLDPMHVGLATVAMAVAASSAFPGFFPPLELTGADVGSQVGEFGRQAYTDGGVFDNLGVRMFRCLERQLLTDTPLSRDDFVDFDSAIAALGEASRSSVETPLRRLAQVLVGSCSKPDSFLLTHGGGSAETGHRPSVELGQPLPAVPPATGNGDHEKQILSTWCRVMRHYQFYHDPLFANLKPVDPDAELLLQVSQSKGHVLDAGDQLWLNRHLLEAAFRQATGRACFRRLDSALDGVLVSDVGKPFEIQGQRRAGGLIRTAMRASDILMDRVWQLEIETFHDTPGFVFAPITEVVEPAEDPTALHPEIQRQAANIRTDLDRFSLREISSLVRHGYAVARKACHTRPDLFGCDLPANAPWNPIHAPRGAAPPLPMATHLDNSLREPVAATLEARTLQASALRRIWSTLLDYRDWVSYIYVPIMVPMLILMPYFVVRFYQRSHQANKLIRALTQGNYELDLMTRLLDNGPEKAWIGEAAEEVRYLGHLDFTGFEVLQDSRIMDLRSWSPVVSGKATPGSLIHIYRRMTIQKHLETASPYFRVPLLSISPQTQVRFPNQQLEASVRMSNVDNPVLDQKEARFEASFDCHSVPVGDYVTLYMETQSPGQFLSRGDNGTALTWETPVAVAELIMWILIPEGKEYRGFRITRYQTGKPETVKKVEVVTEYMADDSSIIAFKLQSLKPGYSYEVSWYYKQ